MIKDIIKDLGELVHKYTEVARRLAKASAQTG